ncbi:FKBP prolyl isomerase 16 isoform X2 [Myripristis murdjan]|uniref:FKBP prolyl isomerase 16 isoform X2 n=1 Tax=Myripristis murdjan TaxID=586833 RepID=UPI001175CCCA|nr:peptidyl-prolyl cis-trans isomerase FKBP8-like isoform X2 [Myripristis murdjan]
METQLCCEENSDLELEPAEPEVREAISAVLDEDSPTELSHGPGQEDEELLGAEEGEPESCGRESDSTVIKSSADPCEGENGDTECDDSKKLKKTNSWKTVRFQDPSAAESVQERDSTGESLFPDYAVEEWTSSAFEELFVADDWEDITDDRLLRKKVLEPATPQTPNPTWGQEVTVKMQGVLEDRTVVEKDCKLVFVIGEGDVTQALEECAISMQKDEITLLLADSQYAYGLLGREPDIPAWAPLLYQLQLLNVREKPDPLTLPIPDRIRIGNQKRERGNFHFQREEYSLAVRAYCMALDVLTTRTEDGDSAGVVVEEEEVQDYRVKCLNNLATAQLKLEQYGDALHTSRDVLILEPNNVKALFRAGKAIHVELSKLVKRQSGGSDTQQWKAKPANMLGDNVTPFLIPSKKKPSGISWKFLLGALVVALGSLVTSVILTARN